MPDREKLIRELRKHCICIAQNDDCLKCNEDYKELCRSERELFKAAADELESVTFATDTNVGNKWISVEDDLPKRSEYNFEEYIVTVCRSHWPTSSFDPVDAPYSEEYTTAARYDYDQKVWHLERGEVVLNALLKPEDAPLNGEIVTHWMPLPEPPKEEPK